MGGGSRAQGEIGLFFFVAKKNGKLRIIFDTRVVNTYFKTPPSTRLPTSSAFSSLETSDKPVYVASGDLDCAFYRLGLPSDMGQYFSLPVVDSTLVRVFYLDGSVVPPGTPLLPCLTVLPMGWSWAMHLCQGVLRHSIFQAGLSREFLVEDGQAGVHLETSEQVGCAAYVDKFSRLATIAS